ncbi:unnamed protein product [Sphagnum balticum]
MATAQRTAAVLMAAHSASNADAANASSLSHEGIAPSSAKPGASTMKGGVSFVIPKNKLSGALVPVTRNVVSKWEPTPELPSANDQGKKTSRKTKWGLDLTDNPIVKRGRALALQTRAEQIAAQLEMGHLEIDTNEATRSPSPPPIYDSNGQRINTREGRRREQMEIERREAIGECMLLNPSYKPPAGYKPVYKEAKLFIPVKDYPGYNFIGLILGPRGNTQKRMEAETGTKIAIRGKGAVKEGKQVGRRDIKDAEGAFEDLHVHITADTIEKVEAAVALIEPLLTPVDEDRNTHKRKQLRELAEMNGTMRDFAKACAVCGETGHREWQCDKDKLVTFQSKVSCQICGDGGHPTIDCPRKHSGTDLGQGKVLDKEYLSFLEELNDGLGAAASAPPPATFSAKMPLPSSQAPVIAPAHSIRPSVGPQGPPFVAISMGYPSSGHEASQATDPHTAGRPQPMLITAAGPQPMPSAWSGPPPSPHDGRDNPQTGYYSNKEGGGGRFQPRTAGLGSFSVGFGPRPSNPDFIQSSMGSGGYGGVRYPMFPLEPTPPPPGSMPWDPKRGPPPWGTDMSPAPADYNHHMADQGQGQAFPPYPSPGPGPGQQPRPLSTGSSLIGTGPGNGNPPYTETRPSGIPQPPMFHPSGVANSLPLLPTGGNSNVWDVRSRPPPMSGTASMWPQQMGPPHSPKVWEHRPPLDQTSGVPTAVSSQRMPSPSWSSAAPTPVSLPDSPWNTSVPIRPNLRPWQGMATTLLPPQHLPVQQRPLLPFAAGPGGVSSYSAWKGPGLPGPHPPLGGAFPGTQDSGRKSFDPFLPPGNLPLVAHLHGTMRPSLGRSFHQPGASGTESGLGAQQGPPRQQYSLAKTAGPGLSSSPPLNAHEVDAEYEKLMASVGVT